MFTLPSLPYAYDALEPHLDAQTMEIHHTKHHQGYTDKLNAAVEGTELADMAIEDILANVSAHPPAVRNNGGGFYNHSLFWESMTPDGGGEPSGDLAEHLAAEYGSFADFQKTFNETAGGVFGSGWAWLIVDADGGLQIGGTPNQDNPLMDVAEMSGTPILGLDVWEHAYYLNYQNKRPDYVSAWWNVVNWDVVSERYKKLV